MDDEKGKSDVHHLTSASAFVEGGIQEACDDSCSICLDSFCETDPSTVTNCKHEFHLQCILEWCQRSSHCPMCWQLISLKEPSSQELFDAVEHERKIRLNPPTRNTTTIFRHPTLGDFELQHLPGNGTGSELEERIIQHLAAAAAMGRSHHLAARRELGQIGTDHRHPHFLVFSTHSNTDETELDHPSASVAITGLPSSVSTVEEEEDSQQLIYTTKDAQDSVSASASGSTSILHYGSSSSSSNTHLSPNHQEKAGPSDLQSFSEAIRSRFNTLSMRYKESITKGTKGWKDRLLSRNTRGMNEGTTSAAVVSGQTDNSIRDDDSVDNHHLIETGAVEPISDS